MSFIDNESCLNPLFLATPNMAAEMEVLSEFPRGMLGYLSAHAQATEKGTIHLFKAAFTQKVEERAERIAKIARHFIGGYATYLRQRGYAAERGPEALSEFDAGVEAKIADAIPA